MGLVQRSASGHTRLPDLGGRIVWNSPTNEPQEALHSSACTSSVYTFFVSRCDDKRNRQRVVPGDIIYDSGHVAIINYITEARGRRELNHFHIIHAVDGKEYNPVIKGRRGKQGRVATDDWTWEGLNRYVKTGKPPKHYKAYRLKLKTDR